MGRPRSSDPSVPLTISLPTSLINEIKKEAAWNREGVSSWVRRVVEKALDEESTE